MLAADSEQSGGRGHSTGGHLYLLSQTASSSKGNKQTHMGHSESGTGLSAPNVSPPT